MAETEDLGERTHGAACGTHGSGKAGTFKEVADWWVEHSDLHHRTFEQFMDRYYTRAQAAPAAKVNPITISRWVKEGKIKAYHIGREVLVEKQDIERYQREQHE